MEDNKVMKNMEYWKKKNNIPGIEALEQAGLADGRAKSSAFQMAAPVVPNAFEEDENTEVGKELFQDGGIDALENFWFAISNRIEGEIEKDITPFRPLWNNLSDEWKF